MTATALACHPLTINGPYAFHPLWIPGPVIVAATVDDVLLLTTFACYSLRRSTLFSSLLATLSSPAMAML